MNYLIFFKNIENPGEKYLKKINLLPATASIFWIQIEDSFCTRQKLIAILPPALNIFRQQQNGQESSLNYIFSCC